LWTSLSSNLAAEVVTSAGYDRALIKPCAHRLVAKGVPVGTLVMNIAFCRGIVERRFQLCSLRGRCGTACQRLGCTFGAGQPDLIAAMTKVQSQISSGACSIAQAATAATLDGAQDNMCRFCAAFQARRDLVVAKVAAIDGLTLKPQAVRFTPLSAVPI
jgi:hypothetical protein